MRIDVITIFPDYLAPLDLSLIGRARERGLIDLWVHDLRDFTHDRHRSVDDTPYGGGAGMVMRPEPWGEALQQVRADAGGAAAGRARLLIPDPSGTPLHQGLVRELAGAPWLVIACGRYEGIDERVYAEADETMDVLPVSLGDYVLNGGEVAALAIVEAVVRLVPGVVGNAESLVQESHEGGLLEYPVYTKPASWRGLEVPEVLLSGDHGRIATWRHDQAVRRTVERRPDLMPPTALTTADSVEMVAVTPADLAELLVLQRCCWLDEAQANERMDVPALLESADDVAATLEWRTWVGRSGGRLVTSGRGRRLPDAPQVWEIGRLMVAPDLRHRGLGSSVLAFVESQAPADVTSYVLTTGNRSAANIRMYRRSGYRELPRTDADVAAGIVRLGKRRRARTTGADAR